MKLGIVKTNPKAVCNRRHRFCPRLWQILVFVVLNLPQDGLSMLKPEDHLTLGKDLGAAQAHESPTASLDAVPAEIALQRDNSHSNAAEVQEKRINIESDVEEPGKRRRLAPDASWSSSQGQSEQDQSSNFKVESFPADYHDIVYRKDEWKKLSQRLSQLKSIMRGMQDREKGKYHPQWAGSERYSYQLTEFINRFDLFYYAAPRSRQEGLTPQQKISWFSQPQNIVDELNSLLEKSRTQSSWSSVSKSPTDIEKCIFQLANLVFSPPTPFSTRSSGLVRDTRFYHNLARHLGNLLSAEELRRLIYFRCLDFPSAWQAILSGTDHLRPFVDGMSDEKKTELSYLTLHSLLPKSWAGGENPPKDRLTDTAEELVNPYWKGVQHYSSLKLPDAFHDPKSFPTVQSLIGELASVIDNPRCLDNTPIEKRVEKYVWVRNLLKILETSHVKTFGSSLLPEGTQERMKSLKKMLDSIYPAQNFLQVMHDRFERRYMIEFSRGFEIIKNYDELLTSWADKWNIPKELYSQVQPENPEQFAGARTPGSIHLKPEKDSRPFLIKRHAVHDLYKCWIQLLYHRGLDEAQAFNQKEIHQIKQLEQLCANIHHWPDEVYTQDSLIAISNFVKRDRQSLLPSNRLGVDLYMDHSKWIQLSPDELMMVHSQTLDSLVMICRTLYPSKAERLEPN